MNWAEQIALVQQMLGDTKEEHITRPEIGLLCNMGQAIVGGVLSNIEQERFVTSAILSGTDTDGEFALPTDLRRIVRMEFQVGGSGRPIPIQRWPAESLKSLIHNPLLESLRGARHYFVEVGGRVADYLPGQSRVRLYPSMAFGDSVTLYYVKMHTDLYDYDFWDGSVTYNLGAPDSLGDNNNPFAGTLTTNGVDDKWLGAELLMKTGSLAGQRTRVSNFIGEAAGPTYGVFNLNPSLGGNPVSGNLYQVSMVSLLPPQHHHLVCYYAAALGAPKCNLDPGEFMSYFEDEMDRMRIKWLNNVTANVPGQIPNAPRRSMVEG